MSESAAKATRRQLRRAVGDVASAALTEQSQLVVRHDRLIAELSHQIDALWKVVDDLSRQTQALP